MTVTRTLVEDNGVTRRYEVKDGPTVIGYDEEPAPGTPAANQATVAAAIKQAIVDMQAIIDTADIPAGDRTITQLSNNSRTAQQQLKSIALRVKQLARMLNGDFSSST